MAQTTPPTITTLPTPPTTSDPTTFNTRADAFLSALLTFATQIGSVATNCYNNAVDCFNNAVAALAHKDAAASSASAAAASAVAAAATAADIATLSGAPRWVSGTTYTAGFVTWSPANALLYRRGITGAGTTDPSADPANWIPVSPAPELVHVSGTTHAIAANTIALLKNVAATAVTLPATPGANDKVWLMVGNGLYTNTVLRNGKPIMGIADDLKIDSPHAPVGLVYIDAVYGWRII